MLKKNSQSAQLLKESNALVSRSDSVAVFPLRENLVRILQQQKLDVADGEHLIDVQVNVDGLPPFRSSPIQI